MPFKDRHGSHSTSSELVYHLMVDAGMQEGFTREGLPFPTYDTVKSFSFLASLTLRPENVLRLCGEMREMICMSTSGPALLSSTRQRGTLSRPLGRRHR